MSVLVSPPVPVYQCAGHPRALTLFARALSPSLALSAVGGLLAAYDLSHDPVFLQKADDLGSRLVKAYDTPSGLPHGQVNLGSGRSNNFSWNSNKFILAEVATQQVEYRYLARITGKTEYAKKSERVFEILHEMQLADGLLFQNIRDGNRNPTFADQKVSFGGESIEKEI